MLALDALKVRRLTIILTLSFILVALRPLDVAPAAPADTTSGNERRLRTLLGLAGLSRTKVGQAQDRSARRHVVRGAEPALPKLVARTRYAEASSVIALST